MSTDLHSLLAPYVLDALDADERASFELHLQQCETCAAELPGFIETMGLVGESNATAPPAALRTSVLEAVRSTPQQRPVPSLSERRNLRRRLPQLVAAAAVLAAVAGGGFAIVERDQVNDLQAGQDRMASVLTAADATTVSEPVSTGGALRVIASKSRGAAVVSGSALKQLSEDRVYQLWTMRDGKPTSAGLIGRSDGMVFVPSIRHADAFAVTVEPRGGSKQPTTVPLAMTAMNA